MPGDEAMERIDQHMRRGNELMALIRQDHEDLRVFIRDITTRHERVTDEMIRELRAGRATLENLVAESRATRRDFQEESKALRDGFLAVIDELRRHGLGPATT